MEIITDIIIYILLAVIAVALIIVIAKINALEKKFQSSNDTTEIKNEIVRSRGETLQNVNSSFQMLGDMISRSMKESAEAQDRRLADLNTRFSNMAVENEQKLDNIRGTMETKIKALTDENNMQLEKMRATVDEKLQKTLEERLSQSFKLVSERLEEVYKGLGEMQSLASGVGDLKKVLSNVKTRGILGEIQLSAILEQILTKDQYDENVATKKGSSDRVEFAIRLPGDDDGVVYLPIDAKFPADKYSNLSDAYELGDKEQIEACGKALETSIKASAKYIHDKYVDPPATTDFAILFLPFEGLYAEVVRRGMVEILQRDYKVNIAGPATMAALLNSLQMGFRTLAIEKHSSQVWDVLGAVKTEFGKFEKTLKKAQERINQANNELDALIGTRTNVIQRKLRNVTSLPDEVSSRLLEIDIDEE